MLLVWAVKLLRLRRARYVCVSRMLEIGCVCDVAGSLRALFGRVARICFTIVFVSFDCLIFGLLDGRGRGC